jgi:hypothetical protein
VRGARRGCLAQGGWRPAAAPGTKRVLADLRQVASAADGFGAGKRDPRARIRPPQPVVSWSGVRDVTQPPRRQQPRTLKELRLRSNDAQVEYPRSGSSPRGR